MGICQPVCFQSQVIQSEFSYQQIQKLTYLQIPKDNQQHLFQKSSILLMQSLRQKMQNILSYPLLSTRLLYKGSQNNFSIKKYLQNYGQQQHTVIICLTETDKIIGFYSPISYSYDKHEHGQTDPNIGEGNWIKYKFKSFKPLIFSVTNNQVYPLKKDHPKKSIFLSKNNQQIMFGIKQFVIREQDNKTIFQSYPNDCSHSKKIPSYTWKSHYSNSKDIKQACCKFHGAQQAEFKVKEFQIWKLKYQQFIDSQILQKHYQRQIIINCFDKKPQHFQRIARYNPGRVSNFLKQHGQQQNVLLICKLHEGQIFALFSPISHKYSGKSSLKKSNLIEIDDDGQWISDKSKKSFIFSVKQKKKYKLKNQQKGIFRCKSQLSICFGNGEFIIEENNKGCYFIINNKSNDKQNSYVEEIKQSNQNYRQIEQSTQIRNIFQESYSNSYQNDINNPQVKNERSTRTSEDTKLGQKYKIQVWQAWKIYFNKQK